MAAKPAAKPAPKSKASPAPKPSPAPKVAFPKKSTPPTDAEFGARAVCCFSASFELQPQASFVGGDNLIAGGFSDNRECGFDVRRRQIRQQSLHACTTDFFVV